MHDNDHHKLIYLEEKDKLVSHVQKFSHAVIVTISVMNP